LTFIAAAGYNSRSGNSYGNIYDISSAQDQEEEDARLPRENEHRWRSQRDQEEKEKRTEKTGPLRDAALLLSLRKKGDFKRVFESGRKFSSRHLVIYAKSNGLSCSRLGFAVSRKIGNAVVRNRVRRRLREAVRKQLTVTTLSCDLVIVARSAAVDAAFGALERDIGRGLSGFMNENGLNSNHSTL
jgi:ribonuclease P protein component